jgi:polynucleotide 5'-hydroxyl-kinase GRC3/NOL9
MVKGPATVTVDGTCEVLGSDVSGQRIEIRAGKALPFEPHGRCRLRARFGRGGRIWLARSGAAGVSMWHDISRKVVSLAGSKKITIMLAGDADTGKSTLSAYLANKILGSGIEPWVVDGDIGQSDLAPPGSIGAAMISKQITDLRDASPTLFEFVGSISPIGFEHFVARKLKSILERVGAIGDFRIVNTDGYVRENGVQYKLMLAKELQPDVIVCLENPALLDALQDGPWQVLPARASSQAPKTRYERRIRRLDQFLKHVGSGSFDADLTQITFLFKDRLFSPSDLARPPILQMASENMNRMFVGLGSGSMLTGFGIITDIAADRIRVQTDVDYIDRIYLSNIRLCSDGPVEIRLY